VALTTYKTGRYPVEYLPTVFIIDGVDLRYNHVSVDVYTSSRNIFTNRLHSIQRVGNKVFRLTLYNFITEEYDRLKPLDYAQTDVALIFVRLGTPSTYENAEEKWVPELLFYCRNKPLILVGAWVDDDQEFLAGDKTGHEGYTKMGEDLARLCGAVKYIECNISTQAGLKETFDEVSRTLSRRAGAT
jgi:GTPase SAR1 family protein